MWFKKKAPPPERPPCPFKIGDVVGHKASGQRAVVYGIFPDDGK